MEKNENRYKIEKRAKKVKKSHFFQKNGNFAIFLSRKKKIAS